MNISNVLNILSVLQNLKYILLITNIMALAYSVLMPVGYMFSTNYYYKFRCSDSEVLIHAFSVMSILAVFIGVKKDDSYLSCYDKLIHLDIALICSMVLSVAIVAIVIGLIELKDYTKSKRGRK